MQPTLLLVDDDELFCQVLSGALRRRGFQLLVAHNIAHAVQVMGDQMPGYAVVDLNMPGESGLQLVKQLHQRNKDMRIVVFTGYASIATAVEAIKLGATHYLAKPADADELVAALERRCGEVLTDSLQEEPMSTRRLEWEHIQKVLIASEGNISETARKLNMHRRTLQRKLAKNPPKN
ncbi:MAG: response regulator transcription factor [Mariprofundus sp.]|nr:response regulator transcription factor [Mariprofundus sp.]